MDSYQQDAKIFKALCDPKRLAILEQLRSGEKCACKLQEPPSACRGVPVMGLRKESDLKLGQSGGQLAGTGGSLGIEQPVLGGEQSAVQDLGHAGLGQLAGPLFQTVKINAHSKSLLSYQKHVG